MKKVLIIMVCMGMLGLAGMANAVVLTFDDLPPYDGTDEPVTKIPDTYGGFSWSEYFYYTNPEDLHSFYNVQESGFSRGLVSSDAGTGVSHVAYNDSAVVVSVTGSTFDSFDFNSVWLTAAWKNNLNITVDGYREGVLKYARTVQVNWDSPQQFAFNYLDVDTLVFTSYGGDTVDENDDGVPDLGFDYTHFVMDDFTYNEEADDVDGYAELNGLFRAFISRNFGKKIKVRLHVKNSGNAKAEAFDIAMYLSEDGISVDELLDERRLCKGLKTNRSRNIKLEHCSETSMSGKYLIFVIDSQYEILELDKFNNVKTILVP